MKWREVAVRDAVGLTLGYDLTGIAPGMSKGAVLRRGHVLRPEDLDLLARIGKDSIRILELEPGEIHEDEAALALAAMLAGPGIEVSLAGEAWADLRARHRGLLRVDSERLLEVNRLGELLIASRHDKSPVRRGDTVARAKVLGLAVEESRLVAAARIAADGPILAIVAYRTMRAGLLITGREVRRGLVEDAFSPLLERRLADYGSQVAHSRVVADDVGELAEAIRDMLQRGVDLLLVTGGMSPDDSTAEAIRRAGVDVVGHGVPVSPGAMTLLGYAGSTAVMGVPACAIARPRGLFDLLLPRVLTGEVLSARALAAYGHGGLCWGCEACVYPACPFGKGTPC
ncbi:MAG TPA: molybdopterin-binding protein [Bacillota bacterium]|nr:molybdopterin-binding protein [Bacillota bacterium]